MARRRQLGFSLVELIIVIAIILLMTAVAVLQIQSTMRKAKADSALQITLGQMRRAHELAIDLRRPHRVSYLAPRTIQIDRVDTDGFGNRVFTFISSISLPQETQFMTINGVPVAPGLTPDGLGTAANAIDFSVDFGGGATQIYFQPDGRALDAANRLNSGVVYTAMPGDLMSLRAVSLLAATGRVKGWRLAVLPDNTIGWRQ